MDRSLQPRLVQTARESRGLTQSTLAERAGITQGMLSKIERGETTPSDAVVGSMAKALRYPPSLFYEGDRVDGLPQAFYRARKSIARRLVKQVAAEVNLVAFQIDRLLDATEIDAPALPTFSVDDDRDMRVQVERAAQEVRRCLRIPHGPIENLVGRLEVVGVIIVPMDWASEKLDAVSIARPGLLPPVIFINTSFPADRLRFTLCHELGHCVLHNHVLDPGENVEAEADCFAAEFLLPRGDIQPHLRASITVRELAQMKPYWGASMAAILRRGRDIGRIPERRYKNLVIQMSRLGYRKNEPVDLEPETPELLDALVAYHQNELGYSDAELNRTLNTLDRSDWPNFKGKPDPEPAPRDRPNLRLVRDDIDNVG
jgi:Zn-dependent peptidase ImmA (M78 family)/transcriptional regulator with XRE-family HTH domain